MLHAILWYIGFPVVVFVGWSCRNGVRRIWTGSEA
jgi:hypothetical protein